MTSIYDEMRETPDPDRAEALRRRLHAALATERTVGDTGGPSRDDEVRRSSDEPPSPLAARPAVDRWTTARFAAVAAALLLAVGGLALLANTRERNEPVTPVGPAPVPPAAATTSTTSTTTTTTTTTTVPIEEAEPIPATLGFAAPGRYEFDELGVPITFSNPVDYLTVLRTAGAAVFIEWEPTEPLPSAGDPLRSINFERVGSWYSAEEAVDSSFAGLGSFGPNDIDGWIADNPVIVDRFPATTIGGRSTRVFDARPDPNAGVTGDCLEVFRPCLWVSTLSAAVVDDVGHHDPNYALGSGFVSRFWLVDMGEFEPILIKVSAPENDTAWFDDFASTVLTTIEFGEPQELTP